MLRHIDRISDSPKIFAAVLDGFVCGMDEGWFPPTRRTPSGDESAVWIEFDDGPLAFATFYQPDHRPMIWIDLIWIGPNDRRAGHGSRLVDWIIHRARENKIERVELGTLPNNEAMQGLADAQGFDLVALSYQHKVQGERE